MAWLGILSVLTTCRIFRKCARISQSKRDQCHGLQQTSLGQAGHLCKPFVVGNWSRFRQHRWQVRSSLHSLHFPVTDPFTRPFSTDFATAPTVGLVDIFNFLVDHRTDFDRKSTKAYKSFEDYCLFHDGHVLGLQFWCNEEFCCCQVLDLLSDRRRTSRQIHTSCGSSAIMMATFSWLIVSAQLGMYTSDPCCCFKACF